MVERGNWFPCSHKTPGHWGFCFINSSSLFPFMYGSGKSPQIHCRMRNSINTHIHKYSHTHINVIRGSETQFKEST